MGDSLGPLDGCELGEDDGGLVGTFDGFRDGDDVGDMLGPPEGCELGSRVGESVGG